MPRVADVERKSFGMQGILCCKKRWIELGVKQELNDIVKDFKIEGIESSKHVTRTRSSVEPFPLIFS